MGKSTHFPDDWLCDIEDRIAKYTWSRSSITFLDGTCLSGLDDPIFTCTSCSLEEFQDAALADDATGAFVCWVADDNSISEPEPLTDIAVTPSGVTVGDLRHADSSIVDFCEALAIKHKDSVFVDNAATPRLPPNRDFKARLELLDPDAPPVCKKPYRLSQAELQELSKQIQMLRDSGLITPSSSAWGSPVLFAPKPDGSGLRLCIDYRFRSVGKSTYFPETNG